MNYAQRPRSALRRSDRAKDDNWIKQLLHKAAYATMATAIEGQPFINTNLYYYDETQHCIYFHTAQVGRTHSTLEANPRICFSISEMGRLLPADEALEFSVEYASVVVFGQATIIEDGKEKTYGLQKLLDKYAPHLRPGEHYRPITPDEVKRTAVYRIDIEEWSGKEKVVEPDFPGAFLYGTPPQS